MESMTAAEAKQKFGRLLDKSSVAPVAITKHGEAVSVVMSKDDYDLDQHFRRQWLADKIKRSGEDLAAGRVHSADEVRQHMMALIDRLYTDQS